MKRFIEGADRGQSTDIDAMAWYYLGVLQAVLNFPQAGADPSMLHGTIDVAMSVWPSTLFSHS
jgi:hypothetical protein